MNEIYQLSNWNQAVIMKNSIDKSLKIIVAQKMEDSVILGYVLKILSGKEIVYCVPVECSGNNVWSLSKEDAISFLNIIGFQCEWVGTVSDIPVKAKNILISLYNIGYKTIIRSVNSSDVLVMSQNISSNLSELLPEFMYSDWSFLQVNRLESIETLLNV